jgi:hypothetical protein
MRAANINYNLVDTYLELLKSLNPDSKRELIARLSETLKATSKPDAKTLSDLFGAFDSKESAEEVIADIVKSRTGTRKQD